MAIAKAKGACDRSDKHTRIAISKESFKRTNFL
jgi:hypothetical protein